MTHRVQEGFGLGGHLGYVPGFPGIGVGIVKGKVGFGLNVQLTDDGVHIALGLQHLRQGANAVQELVAVVRKTDLSVLVGVKAGEHTAM